MGLDKTTADREKKLSVTDAQYWRNIVKDILRNCYHTKAGIRIWDKIIVLFIALSYGIKLMKADIALMLPINCKA
ncbi:MAG: hypothetical protein ACLR0U_26860 [Enterocloster clostridioformis]